MILTYDSYEDFIPRIADFLLQDLCEIGLSKNACLNFRTCTPTCQVYNTDMQTVYATTYSIDDSSTTTPTTMSLTGNLIVVAVFIMIVAAVSVYIFFFKK